MPGRRPLPPRWVRREPAAPPLTQFVLLSMLFHMLAILMFGAPSGGSREGRAMWGSLQVVLQGAPPEPPPPLKLDRGTLRTPPEGRRAPGGETPGVSRPLPPPAPVAVPETFPKLLDRIVVPNLKLEKLPSLRVPPPTETPHVPRPLPDRSVTPEPVEAAPVPEPPPAVAAPAPPMVTPPVESPPVETAVVPVPATPPVERPAVEAPVIPVPAPAPVARPPVVETPALPVPAPAPPIERPPVEVPVLPVPHTQSVAPPRIEAPSIPAEKPLPAEVPLAPTPPPTVERAAPRAPEPAEVPRKVEPEVPMKVQPSPRELPLRTPSPAGVPRETAPSTTYDPTAAPPSVDLDAVRKRAGQMAREGSGNRALLPFPMPPPPEHKTKEQIAIENARKPDCRTAYKGLGLLAVAPLIANEFGEGTCRW